MLTAGELAGLIVATFWAILVCFMAVVLVKLARLLVETTKMVSELSDRVVPLLEDVSRTVAETNRQLVAVEAITDNVKDVSGNMVKITGVASTLLAGPVIKISALGHGIRAALARRGGRAADERVPGPRRALDAQVSRGESGSRGLTGRRSG
ncbi:DUF948 domain-containing protein [Planotetraspora kaengkrachanensis]|uniref:DUF948 domain-containing protein n=1 Tax=Planotetraspora kaengkrachanensis TaxID=575193 RepID=A0A8J3PZT6_9ACTN|nr:DUF948 domain-containing protein [Planotetraspora kaengkrachanensis]GIG84151.1 hypothetical protein Pka01_72780 [Planotetraspora kaengkrachanensis]